MQPFSNINSTNHSNNLVTVDIRLCGDIPRNEIKERLVGAPGLARRSLHSRPLALNASCLAVVNGLPTLHKTSICEALSELIVQNKSSSEMNQVQRNNSTINDDQVLQPILSVDFFVPNWAVAARGESRLEPVCESLALHEPVDLTKRKAFLAGRSPGCDVQLVHATSSRRHAMLFHHANGSCYIVDCGSAHGTYVNGKRIHSPTSRGVAIPHRVRRGSMIRFGGPGAPCFVLKCFSTTLASVSCNDEDSSQVVKLNTRLNAIGWTQQALMLPQQPEEDVICDSLMVYRKRSFDSLSSTGSLEMEIPDCKRMRCSSPPLSPEVPLRLVSPDPPVKCCRRVTFSMDPPQYFHPDVVTSDVLSDDDEEDVNNNTTNNSS